MLDAAPLSFNLEFQPHGYNNTINIVVTYYGVMSNSNKEVSWENAQIRLLQYGCQAMQVPQ